MRCLVFLPAVEVHGDGVKIHDGSWRPAHTRGNPRAVAPGATIQYFVQKVPSVVTNSKSTHPGTVSVQL